MKKTKEGLSSSFHGEKRIVLTIKIGSEDNQRVESFTYKQLQWFLKEREFILITHKVGDSTKSVRILGGFNEEENSIRIKIIYHNVDYSLESGFTNSYSKMEEYVFPEKVEELTEIKLFCIE